MDVAMSLFEIVYLLVYLAGGKEENNGELSTKIIGLRAVI
jgi:hypothetical protein